MTRRLARRADAAIHLAADAVTYALYVLDGLRPERFRTTETPKEHR
jgi:hypothetical protein